MPVIEKGADQPREIKDTPAYLTGGPLVLLDLDFDLPGIRDKSFFDDAQEAQERILTEHGLATDNNDIGRTED